MSMTRTEAIERLEKLLAIYEMASTENKMIDYSGVIDTLKFSLSALRSVSREQVERMRGYWTHKGIQSNNSVTGYFQLPECECSYCGRLVQQEANFCPACGAPMTDEAVDMMLERWKEALQDV